MGDEPFDGSHAFFEESSDLDDAAVPADRIRRLSDQTLTYYFNLLSDSRVIKNVTFLELMEQELTLRNLQATRRH